MTAEVNLYEVLLELRRHLVRDAMPKEQGFYKVRLSLQNADLLMSAPIVKGYLQTHPDEPRPTQDFLAKDEVLVCVLFGDLAVVAVKR